ncbi:M20/M25/M40 family metallo-hydrolase [Variovorax sp. 2RAF20]|jgi:glutamate carboxypeptidase|uniref:M20/M25/M40 family metallo-hydrolase n=1 Tax=Variovorax sp. CF313 TaxID=1144315 RepID=UPI000270FAA9|nr:M20/M25/M40 family metallo-hydrolase [Variovorax sp. CF313]EJL77121.1 acetylornithine deacetylase/succinyldiaminopimelate desuccinylase-like deacylase [Variovorax sp. CF313]
MKFPHRQFLLAAACAAFLGCAFAAPDARIAALAAKEKPALLDTLKELVSIESGSRDLDGLEKISDLVAAKFKALGGEVELIDPSAEAYRMEDTPEKIGRVVRATFKGTGKKKILLIAHMDTVYTVGMLDKQPFRIEGDKAYGLGIADDKQGVAVITHIVSMLQAMKFKEYGTLTVLINGDEEISSPGARALITRMGGEHDAVLSFEGAYVKEDKLSLATAGIASVTLHVTGKASHAGSAPELGVNALYELSHQILQMRDLSDPATGLKMNWTISKSGSNRNVIPASATAGADVRVLKVSDYDRIEQQVNERVKKQLIPEAKVELKFERRRPPLEATDASRALARHAQQIYKDELGRPLGADDKAAGGGTDAAFAALKTKAPVIERFGLQGFGAHSADAEYVLIDSIEPRLYLGTRMVMDIARAK